MTSKRHNITLAGSLIALAIGMFLCMIGQLGNAINQDLMQRGYFFLLLATYLRILLLENKAG